MSIFIIQIILTLSFGVVIVVASRALPRLPEENKEARRNGSWTLAIEKRLPLQKIDAAMHSVLEKVLRKAKLFIMKADNSVNKQISKLKEMTPVGMSNENGDNGQESFSKKGSSSPLEP